MSIITSFLEKEEESLIGPPVEGAIDLTKFNAKTQYVTHGGRACELELLVEDENRSFNPPKYNADVFSHNQRFLENHLKVSFLHEICYNIPKIYFWYRPEVATQLAARLSLIHI